MGSQDFSKREVRAETKHLVKRHLKKQSEDRIQKITADELIKEIKEDIQSDKINRTRVQYHKEQSFFGMFLQDYYENQDMWYRRKDLIESEKAKKYIETNLEEMKNSVIKKRLCGMPKDKNHPVKFIRNAMTNAIPGFGVQGSYSRLSK